MENSPNQKKEQPDTLSYIRYSGIAIQMIVTLCLAAWGGMKLDGYFHVKTHLITVFLLIFALVVSMYVLIKGLTKNG